MTSRVEELQRMCDSINENGGLDSGEWHTALLAQIAQNLAVIADVMMADRKTESQTGQPCDGCEYSEPYIEYKCTHPSCKYGDEPNSSEKPNNSTIEDCSDVGKE